MAFSVMSKKSGTEYFLHEKKIPSKTGHRKLYFFSKEQKEGTLDALPEGYEVSESSATGLPLLKKKAV